MSDINWEELFQRLERLEKQFKTLEESLEEGSHPWGIKNAVRVTGALELPQVTKINVSESQLVDIYQETPQVLASIAIQVALTPESFRQQNSKDIYLENIANGNYWVIATDKKSYWLLPNNNIKFNPQMITTFQSLFTCRDYRESQTEYFRLIKSAKVNPLPNSQKWQLEKQGEVDFSNTSTISQYQEEIKHLREERQQIQSQLKQFTQDFSHLKQHLVDFSEEQVQMQSQIQQLWQTVASLSAVPLENLSFSQPWKTARLQKTLISHTDLVRCLDISVWKEHGKKQLIASGGFDHKINLWDAQTGELMQTLTPSTKVVNAIAFSPTEPILVTSGDDNQLQLWIIDTFQAIDLPGHSNRILAVTISPDGKTLVSGSRDHTFKIWDLSTLTVRYTLDKDFGTIIALAISPDGKTLLSSHGEYANGTIRFWNLQTGESNNNYFQHTHLIWSIAISPDSQKAAFACRDGTIQIFDLVTAELKQNWEAHADNVWSVAISPDGQFLASGSSDKTIKLWHLASGELINTLTDHTADVYAVAFSFDGKRLVSGSRDKTLKIWRF